MASSDNAPKPDNERENPRTRRVRQVILDAAIELLLEHGANEVTAKRIAEETGVARTTIYRQWPDHPSLVLATIEALVAPHGGPPDTGDLAADLTKALTDLRSRLVLKEVRPVFAALFDHASRDEAFVVALRTFSEALVWPVLGVLKQSQERGELPAELDSSSAAAMLTGPLLYQHLLVRADIPDDMIEASVLQFLQAQPTRP